VIADRSGGALVLGRVMGFRGQSGEMTVRVASGDAARWTGLRVVALSSADDGSAAARYDVEAARAYADRLVLKLRGVDDASAAAAWRGARVVVPPGHAAALPSGSFYVERLVGRDVIDAAHGRIGAVVDVLSTGGADVLVVRDADRETLVPFARAIVSEIDAAGGPIHVRLPEGLLGLNEPREPEAER
jgi:16S rRNA processing protein RimM